MAKWAVSIGVKKAGLLPELQGAVNGARDFDQWARGKGYESILITDEEQPVTIDCILANITHIVEKDFPNRLLIYFAGHGVEKPDTPVWLLSGWEKKYDETVNVLLTVQMAKLSGISRVGIFADACRNLPDMRTGRLTPQSIFPTQEQTKNPARTQCDQFFSCRFGESSQEVSAKGAAAAYGVFTKCLINALKGLEQKAIDVDPLPGLKKAVTSEKLADFLDEAVPFESGSIPGAEVQIPDNQSSWRRPDMVYNPGPFEEALAWGRTSIAALPALALTLFASGAISINTSASLIVMGLLAQLFNTSDWRDFEIAADWITGTRRRLAAKKAVTAVQRKAESQLEALTREFDSIKGRARFETEQGFTIIGDRPVEAVVSRAGRLQANDIFLEKGDFQIRGPRDHVPRSIAIRLESGNWIATALLPRFIGVILVKDGVAASLSYVASSNGPYYGIDARYGAEISGWTALMHQGRFASRGDLRNSLRRIASDLRRSKHTNPSLGILAAYAYDRAGDMDEIDSIAGYFAYCDQPVPYDIAMLAESIRKNENGELEIETDLPAELMGCGGLKKIAPIAGSFPLLTRGWSLLELETEALSQRLLDLRKSIVRSLWTTLSPEGGSEMADMLKTGEL
jgi:hypothetical protein